MKPFRTPPAGRALVADTDPWRWQNAAACRGEDLALFYGPPHERPEPRAVREKKALTVCAACPVVTRAACLEAALIPAPKAQHGVQGGHTAAERVQIRRTRQRHAAASRAA